MNENPYAAPKEEPSPPPSSPDAGIYISPHGSYRRIGSLQKILTGLLGIGALLALCQIFALTKLNEANQLSDDDPASGELIDQAWNLSDQIGNLDVIVIILTIIVWCFWKNRSCKNAWVFVYRRQGRDAILSDGPTPSSAVWSYFIPILNLFKPYQAMVFIRDLVSEYFESSKLLLFWWITWLIGSNVGSIWLIFLGKSWILKEDELELEELTLYNNSLILDNASYVISCLVAATVIHLLSIGQRETARRLEIEK